VISASLTYAPYEARYFHDLLVELFSRAALAPVYVQHLAQIHSVLAIVQGRRRRRWCRRKTAVQRRSRFGRWPTRSNGVVELYSVWRHDNDNPLLPVIASIARDLAGGA
jgi:hypothetical protein